jgi:hypothetical protein
MKTAVLSLLLLLGVASAALADDYTYNSADGYYYSGGVPYTREKYAYTAYSTYQYGCYTYSYPYTAYDYRYYKVKDYKPAVSYQDADWRTKLLEIAKQRDAFEGKLRASANEHNQYIEAVGALGLTGNFAWQSYGTAPALANPYRNYGVTYPQVGNYGASGKTLYGYSYQSLVDAYGTTDTNVLYQQAAALAKNAQELGGQATSQFSGLVEQTGSNQARVAEILAKGAAARNALEGATAASSVSTRTTIQSSGTGTGSAGTVDPPSGALSLQSLSPAKQRAIASCIECHSGAKPKGGYDVTQHWQLSPESQAAVVERLVLPETDEKFMPRSKSGGHGKRLPPSLVREFMPAMPKVQ